MKEKKEDLDYMDEEEIRATRILNGVISGDKVYTEKEVNQMIETLRKKTKEDYIPKSKIEEKIDNYIDSLLENLDDDRRWYDIELVDNFKQLKKDLLGK